MSNSLRAQSDSLRNPVPYSRPPTPSVRPLQVGFIGLGAMGYLMARNFANNRPAHRDGLPPVSVWNRTVSKSEKLLAEVGQDKVHVAQSAAQVASECDVIITNLANDVVVKSIYQDIAKALTVHSFTIDFWKYARLLLEGPSSDEVKDVC